MNGPNITSSLPLAWMFDLDHFNPDRSENKDALGTDSFTSGRSGIRISFMAIKQVTSSSLLFGRVAFLYLVIA